MSLALFQPTRGDAGGCVEGIDTGHDGYSANKRKTLPICTDMLAMERFWRQLTIVDSLKTSRDTASREDAGSSITDLHAAQQSNQTTTPTSLVCSRIGPRHFQTAASDDKACIVCTLLFDAYAAPQRRDFHEGPPSCDFLKERRKGKPKRVGDAP
jgi:hypothetical protein